MELVIGSGRLEKKSLGLPGQDREWVDPVFLDINPDLNPDVVWDLNKRPLPFDDNTFDELHAYHVLEHVGVQGDYVGFFEEFWEYYRILKPMGHFMITMPSDQSIYAFVDPGHTRAFSPGIFNFLNKKNYKSNEAMSDYSRLCTCDFNAVAFNLDESKCISIILQAIKPNSGD